MVPAALFLVMVVAGSMHGLVAFGLNVLGWQDVWEYLVRATLDGVSVAFALAWVISAELPQRIVIAKRGRSSFEGEAYGPL